jgi:glutamyl-tRNA reductase
MITHLYYNIREISDLEKFKNGLLLYTRNDRVIIQTCQRLEIYSGEGEINAATALHLFRLVSGLESIFIGDTAIKTQVKNAYLESANNGRLGKGMHKLFQWAFYVGKLVRSNTGIAIGAVTYPQTVVNILKTISPDLSDLNITLVGINDITHKLLKWLSEERVVRLNLINRSIEKAENIAAIFGARAFQLDDLSALIKISDVVILCTSAPGYLLKKPAIPSDKKLCIIDLSWPQNADPEVRSQKGVQFFTLDQIENSIHQNLEIRKKSVQHAEGIIEQELQRLMAWQTNRFRIEQSYSII